MVGTITSPYHPDTLWSPLSLISNRYGAPSMVVNWQEREADHSLPTSAEVMKTWTYQFTPKYVFKK
jgi:hypothetical protein